MELHHEFTVPVAVDEAWRVLLDIERVAPCMPGATVEEFDGKTVTGTVKVKVGPITVTYRGTAVFEELDESAHRLVLGASGRETRGPGTARATVTGTLTEQDGATHVSVRTDLAITGRPAQFGRGVMAEVGEKLVGQFADCLSEQLTAPPAAAAEAVAGAGAPAAAEATEAAVAERPAPVEAEPIDLVRTAGLPVAKRAVAAVLAAAAVAALIFVAIRRRR
ncbi:SRPBCC family protein [Streptomyces himalayensis]|uniref:SRPBCC family protein n=1 Tax=Streptomyces himalayensis subsp. himalayensis TaxID=2756131 RepID=A0A7W0DJ67_9ACTN|nr:SRPBCC family protein [Streptomyces himalayensis]MBA2946092.1 SRPBCC family protein [Streptomyces himalayensis subsp. himalayensis]